MVERLDAAKEPAKHLEVKLSRVVPASRHLAYVSETDLVSERFGQGRDGAQVFRHHLPPLPRGQQAVFQMRGAGIGVEAEALDHPDVSGLVAPIHALPSGSLPP